MKIGTYILKRCLLIIPTFLGITIMTFLMVQLAPGNPVSLKIQQLGGDGIKADAVSREVIEATKKLYGLDQPIYIQYERWLKRLVTLDFGESFKDHRPVITKLKETLPITLILNLISIFFIYIISVPLGVYSALVARSWQEKTITLTLFILYSLPSFWVAILLLIFFSGGEYWNVFPMIGLFSEGVKSMGFLVRMGNFFWHLVLPVIVLTYGGFAFLTRFTRNQLLDVIQQDYVRTARAKGLEERWVIYKHALRNAMIPLVTLSGTLLPGMIGGSIIVEQIFSIPGMGRLGFEAVLSRDYPTIMAIASLEAILTLLGLLLSDILYVIVDPRISFEKAS